MWDLIQEIRYRRDGQPATARTVIDHSRFRSASRSDVVYERAGQQVRARMYVPVFSSPAAGDEILYLPDQLDEVILHSPWPRFLWLPEIF